MKEGTDEDHERYQTILNFHDRFLQILCRILHKAGATIEHDSEDRQ
jgi:hypothetical protein